MKPLEDTICALSSAPGRAAIALVRVSGGECFRILKTVFVPDSKLTGTQARHASLGRLLDPRTGAELDRVLVTRFPAPHSYTGEDVAEISLHGSPVILHAVLQVLVDLGARLAEPGEFTMRAFLQGHMDLAQAEAVRDTIEAVTIYQAQVAARQSSGQLSIRLAPLKQELVDIIVRLETAIEFAEERLVEETRGATVDRLDGVVAELDRWVGSFRRGRIIHDGFVLAVVGRPNVGKSSIFNALLEQDRSIVTEYPGTTRDLVTEHTSLGGIPVRLMDTAGVREAVDRAEQLGVERSYGAISDADAILLVIDASQPVSPEDELLRNRLAGLSFIGVFNKSDLAPAWTTEKKTGHMDGRPWLDVSARTGDGIEGLRSAILTHLFGQEGPEREGMLVTNLRHFQCLEAARERAVRGLVALRDGISEEYVLADLHASLASLGRITGETGVEDILDEIFSRFCVGK